MLALLLAVVGGAAAAGADYADGFARLRALGLPDTERVPYVTLALAGGYHRDPWGWSVGQLIQERQELLTGHGWLLSEKADGSAELLVIDGRAHVISVWPEGYWERLRKEDPEGAKEREDKLGHFPHEGSWAPADLGHDLRIMTDALRLRKQGRLPKAGEEGGRFPSPFAADAAAGEMVEYVPSAASPENLAVALRVAALAHRSGAEEEANALTDAVLALADEPRLVLLECFNHLADVPYEGAWQDFTNSCDWDRYRDDMTAILERFPRGWRKAGAVKELLRRMADQRTDDLKIPGLTEEEASWVNALVRADRFTPTGYTYDNWLLTPGFPLDYSERTTPLFELVRHRLRAVPGLLKCLDSEVLVPVACPGPWGAHRTIWDDGVLPEEDDDLPAAVALGALDSSRPATLGEVARSLLSPLVFGSNPSEEQRRPGELASQGREWYERVRQMTPRQYAFDCLEREHMDLDHTAAHFLLRTTTAVAASRELEAWIAAMTNPQRTWMAIRYLQCHGDAAEAFAHALKAIVKEGVPISPGSQRATLLKEISVVLNEYTLSERIALVAEGSGETHMVYRQIAKDMVQRPRREVLSECLAAICSVEGAAPRLKLLAACRALGESPRDRLGRARGSAAFPDALVLQDDWRPWTREQCLALRLQVDDGDEEPPEPLDPTRDRGSWTVLLDDDRRPPVTSRRSVQPVSVAFRTALWIQQLCRPAGEYARAFPSNTSLGLPGVGPLVIARARGLVSGVDPSDLPPLPDPQAVDDDRRIELRASLLAASGDALVRALTGMTVAERIALSEDMDAELRDHLFRASLCLGTPVAEGEAPSLVESLSPFAGRTIDKELIEELIALVRTRAVQRQPVCVTVATRMWQGYAEVVVGHGEPDLDRRAIRELLDDGLGVSLGAHFSACVGTPGGLSGAVYLQPLEAPTVPADADPDALTDVPLDAWVYDELAFWRAVERVLENSGRGRSPLVLQMGRVSAQSFGTLARARAR